MDKTVIRLLRPFFDAGVRPEGLSSVRLALRIVDANHWPSVKPIIFIRFYLRCMHSNILMIFWNASSSYLSEQLLSEQLINLTCPAIYSTFSDPAGYAGKVPTGHYIATTEASGTAAL